LNLSIWKRQGDLDLAIGFRWNIVDDAGNETVTSSSFSYRSAGASNLNATGDNEEEDQPSPFLRYGATYGGQTADRIVELSESSVAVMVTIDNWSR
jgi:hypothetical protein